MILFFIIFFLILFLFFLYSSYHASSDLPRSLQYSFTPSSHLTIEKLGGFSTFKLKPLTLPTKGANFSYESALTPDQKPSLGYLIVSVKAVGVNYADVCIRWGIYESAKRFVGYPITPGFEFSGVVEESGSKRFVKGDRVFGVTMFGGYSSRILVGENQVFPIPKGLTMEEAAGFPTMSLTAYYALYELFNVRQRNSQDRTVMVHSAAGGVGGMIVQLAKLEGCRVIGVVGNPGKVEYAKSLGCDHVIDKSKGMLWHEARKLAPTGFQGVFDANGVETLRESWRSLSPEGRLVVYGFHTMLPKTGMISALDWIKMAWRLLRTPKFSPMEMTMDNKSVLGFNLSFLFNRIELFRSAMEMLVQELGKGRLKMPQLKIYNFWEVAFAHWELQSGKSMGKIVLRVD